MKNFLSKLKSALFTEREIICVSHCGIKSKKIGCIFLIWNVLLVLWTAFATIRYFELRQKVMLKEDRITELRTDKQKLLSNIVILEKNISNIKNFIFSLNKYDRFATIDEAGLYKNNNTQDNNVELVLSRVKNDMKNINLALIDRINGLERVKKNLKFDNNVQMVSYEDKLSSNDYNIDHDVMDSIVLKKTLDQNIGYLDNLEGFIDAMPFSEPMATNYVTSKFGTRLDPFIKTPREHHGVDLVGSYMAKIYAPAAGKVVFAGVKGGYGKAVIIEHEHNMKTVYGHLNSYNVKIGDVVRRGDIIGVQGNTGRSTGQHLHYEILRGNQRYNPLEFVRIGSSFY